MQNFDSSEALQWLDTVPGLTSEQRDTTSKKIAAAE